MKKLFLSFFAIITTAVCIGWNVNQSIKALDFIDLTLTNIEATASGESAFKDREAFKGESRCCANDRNEGCSKYPSC